MEELKFLIELDKALEDIHNVVMKRIKELESKK